jgi:hypothetical protein
VIVRRLARAAAITALLTALPALLAALPVAGARADDVGVLLDACRTHDGGLPEPVCQCIAAGLSKAELATYVQLAKARQGSDSQAIAFERKNQPFIRKFDTLVRSCREG